MWLAMIEMYAIFFIQCAHLECRGEDIDYIIGLLAAHASSPSVSELHSNHALIAAKTMSG